MLAAVKTVVMSAPRIKPRIVSSLGFIGRDFTPAREFTQGSAFRLDFLVRQRGAASGTVDNTSASSAQSADLTSTNHPPEWTTYAGTHSPGPTAP
jgi:hypothetical protein